FHASLIKISPKQHIVHFALPALCTDFTTFHNLVQEVGTAYCKRTFNGDALDVQLQYGDFSNWQRDTLSSPDAAHARQFWKRRPMPLKAPLPFGASRPPHGDFRPRSCPVDLTRELTARAKESAERSGVPSWCVLFCCWQILLQRLTRDPSL